MTLPLSEIKEFYHSTLLCSVAFRIEESVQLRELCNLTADLLICFKKTSALSQASEPLLCQASSLQAGLSSYSFFDAFFSLLALLILLLVDINHSYRRWLLFKEMLTLCLIAQL